MLKSCHSYFVYHIDKIFLFESDSNFLRSFLFTDTVYYPHPHILQFTGHFVKVNTHFTSQSSDYHLNPWDANVCLYENLYLCLFLILCYLGFVVL